jgi:hypothetical protein
VLLVQTTNYQLSQNEKILHGVKVCREGLGFGLALRRLEGKSIASPLIKTGSWGLERADELTLLFVAKLVANSPNGQNHLRIFRVLFDLGSQPVDV